MVSNVESAGTVIKDQTMTVYLRLHESFDPFIWGGGCMRLEEGTFDLGGFTVTTKQNPRGGLIRDGVIDDPPGMVSATIAMKRLAHDRMKTVLLTCRWDYDKRYHCDGDDLDAWNKWAEITRMCFVKNSNRVMGGSSFSDPAEESMVTFEAQGLFEEDIYRVVAEHVVCETPA